MPFIANEGQADERVKYYAKTFGGTVHITKEGGIVYMLPKREEGAKEDRNCRNGGEGTCYLSDQGAEGTASLFSAYQWVSRLNNKWWQGIAQKATGNDYYMQSEISNPQSNSVVAGGKYRGVSGFSNPQSETCPRLRSGIHDTKLKGVALKEELVGGKICDIWKL